MDVVTGGQLAGAAQQWLIKDFWPICRQKEFTFYNLVCVVVSRPYWPHIFESANQPCLEQLNFVIYCLFFHFIGAVLHKSIKVMADCVTLFSVKPEECFTQFLIARIVILIQKFHFCQLHFCRSSWMTASWKTQKVQTLQNQFCLLINSPICPFANNGAKQLFTASAPIYDVS